MAQTIENTDDYIDGVMYATNAVDTCGSIARRSDDPMFDNLFRRRFNAGWNAIADEHAARSTRTAADEQAAVRRQASTDEFNGRYNPPADRYAAMIYDGAYQDAIERASASAALCDPRC